MQCLVMLTKLNNKPASAESLAHGLPFDPNDEKQRLFSVDKPKANFSRAAAKAGFTSRLQERQLHEIPSVVLPVILILRDDNACVLMDISHEQGVAQIIVPSVDETPMEIDIGKLAEEYLGFVFFLKRKYEGFGQDKRSARSARKGSWFFGTLMKFKGIYGRVFLGTFIINLFVVAGPLFTMNVYDRIIPHNAIDTLWVLASGIFLIYLFDLVLKYIRTAFLETAAKKSDIILSSMLFEQALNLKLQDRPRSVGAFTSNIKDFDGIRSFFASSAITAFIELPFAVIFLLVIYSINPTMVYVPLVVIAPIMAMQYSLEPIAVWVMMLALALGTPVLSLLGAIGAALTLGLRGGGILLSLLILPLYIPVLVYGAGAVSVSVIEIADTQPYFALLGAFLLGGLVLAPPAAAAALRISME